MRRPKLALVVHPILVLSILGLATLACTLPPGVPVTPTLVPPQVISPSPTQVALLPTIAPTATDTATSTPLPTLTDTALPSATNTELPTLAPSATNTLLPTSTDTPLPTATDTEAPTLAPSATNTPLPTSTDTPLPTATDTEAPTFTPVVLTPATSVPQPTFTNTPLPTLVPLPTFTPLPTLVLPGPGNTPVAPPPSTATPSPVPPSSVVILATGPVIVGRFTSTPLIVSIASTDVPLPQGLITIGEGTLQLPPVDSSGQVPLDFDTNSHGHRAVIDKSGNLSIDGVPYTRHPGKRFIQARWSPDGRWLAYTIQTPDAEKGQLGWQATLDDGMWVLDTAAPNAAPNFVMRNHYDEPKDTQLRIVTNIDWAADNDAIMMTVRWPRGLKSILVGKNTHADDHYPGLFDLIDYVNGTWQADSQGYVSASPPGDHPVVMGIVHRDIDPNKVTRLADGKALGLWIQDPAALPDGRYAFLGKPAASGQLENGATQLTLYVMAPGGVPTAVSPALPGEVISAVWSPNRTALLAVVRIDPATTQAVVVTIDGQIIDYTARAHGSTSVHWAR